MSSSRSRPGSWRFIQACAACPKPVIENERDLRLLFVGRLIPLKRVELTLRALALLPDRKIALRVVGSGPLADELRVLSRQLGLTERVEFLGEVDDAALLRE